MFNAITHSRIFVSDQDEALDFYVNKLGLEVSADVDLEVMRWLTVRVPGTEHSVLLESATAKHWPPDTSEQILDLLGKGAASMFILRTDDCHGTFDRLKEKDVEIVEEPTDRFYGIDGAVRDPSGNQIRIVEEKEVDLAMPAKANPEATQIIE